MASKQIAEKLNESAGPTRITPPEMITIPEGEFFLGISDAEVQVLLVTEEWAEEWYARDMFRVEQPQHRLFLPAYEIGRFPVTNEDYFHFIWDAAYRVPREWIGFHYAEEEATHPVVGVARADALAYCSWLNDQMAAQGEASNYRLPSEAEWERAARGIDRRTYPWGDSFDPWRCNTVESGRRGTIQVGIFSPSGDSPWGVSDMVGNVWEWTRSILRPYPYDPTDGREKPASDDVCVIRGGSWYYSKKLARCTVREGVLPHYTSPALGFRLARSVSA